MIKNLIFRFRLDPPMREQLDELAAATGRTRGSVLRELLAMTDLPEVRKYLDVQVRPEGGEHESQPN